MENLICYNRDRDGKCMAYTKPECSQNCQARIVRLEDKAKLLRCLLAQTQSKKDHRKLEKELEETIQAITGDAKIQATLRKKLKGRYEKDKALLEKVAGLPEQEASDWAFLAAEVINWEWLAQVLEAAGWEGTTQEAIDIIRAAVIVEEGMKVGVEAEQPEV